MEKSKCSLECSAKSSSKIEKFGHILSIVAWPWGGQSDLFRYYSSGDEVLLYESLFEGRSPALRVIVKFGFISKQLYEAIYREIKMFASLLK